MSKTPWNVSIFRKHKCNGEINLLVRKFYTVFLNSEMHWSIMSGKLDKAYSMDESQRGQGDRVDQRSLGNGKHVRSQSPLKFFAEAKKSINDVFKDIADYVIESQKFLKGMFSLT